MADAPVTVPVKIVETDVTHPVGIAISNIHEVTKDVINEVITHTDAIISEVQKSPDLNEHVQHLHHALHNACVALTVAGVFFAIVLTVIAASLVVAALALHKIAKQGEVELELEELS
ncbi:hypothetical protein FAI41_03505 [Acetobacteraceae bacterium]|nr:hypothetical protein FAI41_03505 [Acetobacteraceae bacterium]